jgi:hypothetical protein
MMFGHLPLSDDVKGCQNNFTRQAKGNVFEIAALADPIIL